MSAKQIKKVIIEAEVFIFLLFLINIIFFPKNPAFSSVYALPYFITALFFAGYGGLLPGFVSLGTAVFLLTVPFPFLRSAFFDTSVTGYWTDLFERHMVFLAVFLIITYIFSMQQKRFTGSNQKLKAKFRELAGAKHLISNKAKALEEVNNELEERISRQQESITALYNQLKKIETVSVSTVLEVLIETVQIFLKASQVSVRQYHPAGEKLRLTQSAGWEKHEHPVTELPEDGTIEGWVVRNNQLFSMRMLLHYANLRKIDKGHNILTIPLHTGTHLWGILNIEKMPFYKYNLYSEQMLYIIISLFEPALEKAVEYESIIRREEIDADTGLPLFSSFYKMLQEEVQRMSLEQGKMSIIIIELMNYNDLIRQFSEQKVRLLFGSIAQAVGDSTHRQGQAYHYKQENQLAFIFSNLDYDGASLFCLEILEKMNASDWVIDHSPIMLEVIIGYSSYGGDESESELIEKAENLLEMQKM